MKKLFLMSALSALLLLTAFQCGKDHTEPETNPNPDNVRHSECLNHSYAAAKGFYYPNSVDVTYSNGTVHVTHRNLMVNCGTAAMEGGINVTCTRNGSTIDIYEREDESNPQANCMCNVDNEFDIYGLERGTYTFVFHSWWPKAQSFTFTF